jgi:Ca-activated chloride channel family protein
MRLATWTAIVLSLLMLPLKAQQSAPYTVSVDVDLVVLNVRVLDNSGLSVAGLPKDNFRIEEDGQPQLITLFLGERSPATIGLVVDSSGSINSKQPAIEAAAIGFVESSHPEDEFFVVRFNDKIYWTLPEAVPFTDDVALLRQALSWKQPGGRTALYDAVGAALRHTGGGRWDKRALVVLSDGGDNASGHTFDEIVRLAQQSNVMIYTIGLFDELAADKNPGVLRKLAGITGGNVYLPKTSDELGPVWEQIANGIRSQYTIAYRPSRKSLDGRYHKIRVRVEAPGRARVKVYTRPGYLARKADGEQ